ncbi:unnamed protein product [Pseudo-nitzschia multistriata]|uniref:Alpha-ketoglutarate-dependent dioxygenase AlkB-like domain-containing protein n=1 Tax=Pseudo-nitzschia multistriata TaxID=183589 RepID=A0A448ZF43_9STRA|nr:unnamed protein product [Pseudo-nitzschia multistriata]
MSLFSDVVPGPAVPDPVPFAGYHHDIEIQKSERIRYPLLLEEFTSDGNAESFEQLPAASTADANTANAALDQTQTTTNEFLRGFPPPSSPPAHRHSHCAPRIRRLFYPLPCPLTPEPPGIDRTAGTQGDGIAHHHSDFQPPWPGRQHAAAVVSPLSATQQAHEEGDRCRHRIEPQRRRWELQDGRGLDQAKIQAEIDAIVGGVSNDVPYGDRSFRGSNGPPGASGTFAGSGGASELVLGRAELDAAAKKLGLFAGSGPCLPLLGDADGGKDPEPIPRPRWHTGHTNFVGKDVPGAAGCTARCGRTQQQQQRLASDQSVVERPLFTYKSWDERANRWKPKRTFWVRKEAEAGGSGACAPPHFRISLSRGGTVHVFPNLLGAQSVGAVKTELLKCGFWRKYSIQGGDEPRLHFLAHENATDNFENGAQPGYRYTNITMKARPLSALPNLQRMSKQLAKMRNIPSEKWTIGVHPVLYRDNRDSMGDHADDDQVRTNKNSVSITTRQHRFVNKGNSPNFSHRNQTHPTFLFGRGKHAYYAF